MKEYLTYNIFMTRLLTSNRLVKENSLIGNNLTKSNIRLNKSEIIVAYSKIYSTNTFILEKIYDY